MSTMILCSATSTSPRQKVNLGDSQVKTSIKALDVSQEYLRGCFRSSSWPDGDMDLQEESIIWKRSLAIRQKISPISLQHKNLGGKSSLKPLGIDLLKRNSGAGEALSSASTTSFFLFFTLWSSWAHFHFFFSALSKEYLLLLRLYHVMLWQYSSEISWTQTNILYCLTFFETCW